MLKSRESTGKANSSFEYCVLSPLKKYFIRLLLYPFLLTYGYKLLLYCINNNIVLTFSTMFTYVSSVILIFVILEILSNLFSWHIKSESIEVIKSTAIAVKSIKIKRDDESYSKIKACHEAGHYFIAKKFDIPVEEVSIIQQGNSGGRVILDLPNCLSASQIKHVVMIKYAGFLSEKLLIGEASQGCMGGDDSDFITANLLLKQYILLTDESLSFTGYEEDYIKNTSIKISKEWKEEVTNILTENQIELNDITNELLKKNLLTLDKGKI